MAEKLLLKSEPQSGLMMSNNFNNCIHNFPYRLEDYLKDWKIFGAVSTPRKVVRFMLRLSGIEKWEGLNILEPGCGFCNFLREIYCEHPNNNFTGVEVNPKVYEVISKMFPFKTVLADFFLWETDERFDLVIGNPPYGVPATKWHPIPIIIPQEVKEKYKALSETWKGAYNIYGLFIEKGIKLLKDGGKLVYIVPCPFMIDDNFSKLREFLSRSGKLDIYYLGRDVFEKNVTTCVVIVTKDSKLRGVLDLYEVKNNFTNIVHWYRKTNFKGEIIRFENEETKKFEEGKPKIKDLFRVYVDTNLFYSTNLDNAKNLKVSKTPKPGYVCVLKGKNLKPNRIDYNHCYSGFWVPKDSVGEIRWFFKVPHIIAGYAKGDKRKVVVAVDEKCYPWIHQKHLIPKVNLSIEDIKKIADYLNSKDMQQYVKTLYKEVVPYFSTTMLKLLPLPKEYNRYIKKHTILDYI